MASPAEATMWKGWVHMRPPPVGTRVPAWEPYAARILSRLAASTPTTTPPPPATNYYQSLLTQGYDVKDVFLVSASDSTRLSGAVQQQDTVLVTLQKGGATATCWVEFSTWHQQSLGGTSVTCNLLH